MFDIGQLVATPGAIEALARNQQTPLEFIQRHIHHDWGDLDDEDKRENDYSVEHGLRILSAYHLADGTKIWIITEADKSATIM